MPDVEVTTSVAADPDAVYALVSDIRRMGEWSPECCGGQWIRGATGPAVGAWFKGMNRNGRRTWSSKCQVTEAVPGRAFAFDVHFGPHTTGHWGYRIESSDGGCTVTEWTIDRRPRWLRVIYPYALGIKDRAARNRENMQITLERIKEAAETV